jgi:hypothetical protein
MMHLLDTMNVAGRAMQQSSVGLKKIEGFSGGHDSLLKSRSNSGVRWLFHIVPRGMA